jgi:hypothetical protein
MNNRYSFILAVCLLAFAVLKVRADVYTDATNDLFTTGAPQLDIASVTVTNDSTNLFFTIKLVGNPILTNWGSYAIAFVTGSGGATNGNGSGAAINLTKGINYWATCLGWGSQKLYQYNTNTSSWVTNNGGLTFANSSSSVSLSVPYASIGLTSGSSFQFDVYTFSSTGGAVDDLANTNIASSWWSTPYTNNLVESYTIRSSTLPASGTISINVLEDTNTIIWRNPGKGWVSYGTTFPTSLPVSQQAMVNVIYFRPVWATIEPSENTFNWSYIDNAITSAQNNGVKVAFGFLNADVEAYITPNATPQWVFNAGAGYYVVGTNGGYAATNFYVPYWSTNPVFFAKMDAFISALGQRYNGNTNIAWIDIRDFGEWGEGHLGNIGVATNGQIIPYPSVGELETNYFQPYLNAFPNTHLVIPFGTSTYNPAYTWAVQQGAGMRRDGIPNWSDGSDIIFASGYGPAVIEYTDSYDNLIVAGLWTNSVICADILRAKASYSEISWSSDFLNNFSNSMTSIENQMGYHFVLQNVTIPQWLSSITSNSITMTWTNKGVTYLYEPCSVAMALLDSGNNVVGNKSWLSGVYPQLNWAPGPITLASTMSFNSVPAGTYKLAVGLFTSTNQAQPNFMIGNQGRTANGWYVITNISLLNIAQPATNPTNIAAVLSNGTLIISWPADHIGWTLQAQTNSLTTGLGTNWATVANSTTANQVNIPISQTNPATFFRLKY